MQLVKPRVCLGAPETSVNELRSEYEANRALHDAAMLRRRTGLSAQTQQVVAEQFGGDLDEAQFVAAKLVARSMRYPEWVREVAGDECAGWRDVVPWAIRR